MNLYKLHTKPEELDHYDVAHARVPRLIWEKYKDQPTELKKREKIIANDPEHAYLYAKDILKKPFPAGEVAIAKDVNYAYLYAKYVLKGPFPAGEAAIAKDVNYAAWYAEDVLKGPFPAGEAAIAKNAEYAYWYAENILKLPNKEARAWGK